jgi:hypothetical protein
LKREGINDMNTSIQDRKFSDGSVRGDERTASVTQITEDLEYITGWLGYCEDSDFGLSKLQTLANVTGNLRERFAKEFKRIGL